LPQVPQFALSLAVFTHVPLQSVYPGEHGD
jgi:hypothetical protein